MLIRPAGGYSEPARKAPAAPAAEVLVPIPQLAEARAAGVPYEPLVERLHGLVGFWFGSTPVWWMFVRHLPEVDGQPWPIAGVLVPPGFAELSGQVVGAQLNLARAGADLASLQRLTCTRVLADFSSGQPISRVSRIAYGVNIFRIDGLTAFVGDRFNPDQYATDRLKSMQTAVAAISARMGLRIQVVSGPSDDDVDVHRELTWLEVVPPESFSRYVEIVVRDLPASQRGGMLARQLTIELGEIVHAQNALARFSDPQRGPVNRREGSTMHLAVRVLFAASQ